MLAEFYFNLPLFSAVLLLIAGVLIGYALWVPFRGDTESINAQLGDLKEQNDDLHRSLQQSRDAYAGLERKHGQQCDEMTALRVSSKRVEEALRDHGTSVQTIQEIKATALRQLDEERQNRLALESELRASRQETAMLVDEQRRKHQELETELRDSQELSATLKSCARRLS